MNRVENIEIRAYKYEESFSHLPECEQPSLSDAYAKGANDVLRELEGYIGDNDNPISILIRQRISELKGE